MVKHHSSKQHLKHPLIAAIKKSLNEKKKKRKVSKKPGSKKHKKGSKKH